jgi:hypothetical protein
MAIESDYRELFSESASLSAPSGLDKYGKRSFSASPVVVPAHLMSEIILTRSPDGREVVETGKVYLYGAQTVTTDYKITLSDGSTPVILGVDTPHDNIGAHHTVVRVGK